jgi:tetratricopeptide (TPR) repeat protein
MAQMYDDRSAFLHERLAEAWASSGRPQRGRSLLARGLRWHPEAPGLNRVAGLWALRQRQYGSAVAHLSRAVEVAEQQGSPAETRRLPGGPLIDAMLWSGQVSGARRRATELVARYPGRNALALEVGAALEDHGLLEDALRIYREAAERKPADRRAAFAQARVLTLLGRARQAAQSLVRLCRFHGQDAALLAHIARLLWPVEPADAGAYRAAALRQAEGDAEQLTVVAMSDLLSGRLDQGLALVMEAAGLAAERGELRLTAAEVLAQHGQPQSCLRLLRGLPKHSARALLLREGCRQQALRKRPTAPGLDWSLLAQAVRLSKRPGRTLRQAVSLVCRYAATGTAQEQVERLVARLDDVLEPATVVLAYADVDHCLGDTEQALARVGEWVAGRPHDAELLLELAALQARGGRRQEALGTFERLLEERPDDPVRLNALGFTLADAGLRLQQAAVWLRRAHRLAPDDPAILDSLGWLCFRQGRHEQALRLLRRAHAAAPGDAEILGHLAELYIAQGARSRARGALEHALAQHPAPVLRRELQRRLKGLGR